MLPTFVTTAWLASLLATGAGATPPNLAEAILSQQRVVEVSPTSGAINDLANLLVLAGRYDEAEQQYRRALSLDAADTRTRFNLGLLLQSRSDSDEARQLYQAVLEREPRHAWAHYQLGTLFEQQRDERRAVASYARAFALDPELYFADVNPQVVSNRLLTEAILEAARLRRPPKLAPMQYARPREITELLLSLPVPETPAEIVEPSAPETD